MKILFSALIALIAFPLAAQNYRVLSISPSSGPVTGGTSVTIQLNEIPNCPITPPSPSATFGGLLVSRFDYVDATTVRVVTPPHPQGVVDVVLQFCGAGPIVVENVFTYFDPAQPPSPSDFEKILLPVVFYGPGAHGSEWGTRIYAFNAGAEAVESARPIFEGNPMCPAICGCSALAIIQPRQTASVCIAGFSDPMGLLYYPRRSVADNVRFSARIFDASRSAVNGGTEIPVVRERDFRAGSIVLVDVPMAPLFRTAIRLYDPEQHDGGLVRMRISKVDSDAPLVETTVTLSYPIRTIVPDPFPARPAFAFVGDLLTLYPDLAKVSSVKIELTPLTQDMRIWAFATITNNDTQLVTTVSPQ